LRFQPFHLRRTGSERDAQDRERPGHRLYRAGERMLPRARLRRVAVQPFHLPLALAVEARLPDEPGAEIGERGGQGVDLVQRVLDVELGVDVELEVDPVRAVAISRMIRGCGLTYRLPS
jgi:hypothetical protein